MVKLAIPTTIGMISNSIYNLVDTIFIGRGVGTLAIAGIGIVFPIQIIVFAIAQLFGMGAASMVSRNLGKRNYEEASNIAGNSFVASFLFGIFSAIIVIIFLNPLLTAFGATEDIIPFARDYLSIIAIGFIYFPLMVSGNHLIRAEGDAKNSMIVMILAAGVNIILDPIFIFIFDMGIKGAAYATIIAQFSGLVYVGLYHILKRSSLAIKLNHFGLKWLIIAGMVSLGFSSFIRTISMSILVVIVNNSLKIYGGEIAIAVYSVVNRTTMFITMPLFGVVAGSQPMIGFNYGANNMKRVKETLRTAVITTIAIGTIFFLLLMLIPDKVLKLFSNDPELIDKGVFALRMIIMLFPLIGFQFIGADFFQSIGKAIPSIVLSLTRQLLFLIPLIILLPVFMGINGVWISFPIADLFSIILTAIIVTIQIKKLDTINEK
jgi:putative MATE family efflux protein